ncbi:MAG TPA: hypothetical protein VFD19_04750 [Clostridia bacterium]|nr:hypothetical protein [Clostridia bacterium]
MPNPTHNKRPINARKIIGIVILIILGLSVIYTALRLITLPADSLTPEGRSLRQDYVLALLQCLGGFVIMFVPTFLDKRYKIVVPDKIQIMYFIFLFLAIYLGEVQNFFYRVPFWDNILHAFSGGMLAIIGILLVNILNGQEKLHLQLSPFFVVLFGASFAVLLGVVWEIYEFAADGLLGTNMQKFMRFDGELLVGHAALADTMIDLIVDLGSAVIVGTLAYFSLKSEAAAREEQKEKVEQV